MRAQLHMALAGLAVLTLASAARAADDKTALARQALAILKTNCYRCHGQEGATEGGFNFVLDRQHLVARRKIVPGDAAGSQLYRKLKKDQMPPEDEKPRPTPADVEVVRQWIDTGAPEADATPAPRQEIGTPAIVAAIRADLEAAGERDRRFLRYFTLTHLYNAGWSDEELESYRRALSKLVNSLSWGRRVVKPAPVDPARTILRIDLRDYKWSEKTWHRILLAYPYAVVDPRSPAVHYCAEATGCPLPHVRGDWFVAAASRPPLYHDVLDIPATDRALEKLLHVDVEEDIRQERVSRAGFNGSGVSRNNRLIERHESGYGAYWKSYDFAGSAGRQNLFEYPLGPSGPNSFRHGGGEIIFSLPNGLQGYLLVDDRGNRIDKGPTTIVSDPRQQDRAVVNGLSCMSCHAQGMIEKRDQVRDSVLKNAAAFPQREADTILALYSAQKDMDKLLREDAERFARAVAETGCRVERDGKIVGSDPVVNLALLFERELDLPLAAAEMGVKADVFTRAMDRSPALARTLGVLKVEGGTVQRQTFVTAFRELTRVLDLGVYISVAGAGTTDAAEPARVSSGGGRLFDDGEVVYLADLAEIEVKNGEWPFTKDGSIGNKKDRIKVGGKLSAKGLGMHPPNAPSVASVKYRIGKQAATFKTIVAINDTTNWCFTAGFFIVLGDGKELFHSGKIAAAQDCKRTQECIVDVTGVDVLELRTQCEGFNTGIHAVWVDPRLLREKETPDPGWPRVKKLFADGPRDFLSDLTEFAVIPGPWPLGKDGDKGDGKEIRVLGRPSPKGLGLHPPDKGLAAAGFRLGRAAEVFRGAVALDDACGPVFGAAVFEVHGDGKLLWRSRPVNKPKEIQQFSLKVTGVDVLELRVVAPGAHTGLHAVWIEPRLLQTGDAPDK